MAAAARRRAVDGHPYRHRLCRRPPYPRAALFLCVGSNANTGGASSAAIVATAFHPALAPVGVLLGILGYTLGTIGGYITAEILRHIVAP